MPKRNYHLKLKGYVGSADFDAKAVDNILDKYRGEEVRVLIDSTGGSLSTALSISSAFKNHGNVTVHFVGMNASAATVASMGASKVTIDRSAMYLVHKSSLPFFMWGSLNADEVETVIADYLKAKADLDKIDLNLAALYASRCKKKPEELLDIMKTGAWLNADEALEWGFVDAITDFEEDMPAILHKAQANALAKAGLPLPDMPVYSDGLESIFEKFTSFFTNLFSNNKNLSNKMKKAFKNICAILACDSLEVENGSVTITEAQADSLETKIADLEAAVASAEKDAKAKDEEIQKLRNEIENLKKEPAASSSTVIDDSKKKAPANSTDEFIKSGVSALNLFNSLP